MNMHVALTPATTSQPIPFRTDSPVTTGESLTVFGTTILLLAVAVGALLWMRKRGWVKRWSIDTPNGQSAGSVPRVVGQARLGQASHAYVIDVDGARFLVVESSKHVATHALPEGSIAPGAMHE